jgi:hypothetical protein
MIDNKEFPQRITSTQDLEESLNILAQGHDELSKALWEIETKINITNENVQIVNKLFELCKREIVKLQNKVKLLEARSAHNIVYDSDENLQ